MKLLTIILIMSSLLMGQSALAYAKANCKNANNTVRNANTKADAENIANYSKKIAR